MRMSFALAIFVAAIGLATSETPQMLSPIPDDSSETELKTWCNNVDEGEKLIIGLSDTILQDSCDLRAEITPAAAGSLVLTYSILPLTDVLTSAASVEGTYLGMPKHYSLLNKTEAFTASNLFAIRNVDLDDIPLAGLRSYLNGSCGTVYLLGALMNGTEPVDHAIIKAKMECPDESGVDLVPMVTADPSWQIDYDKSVVINKYETSTFPIMLSVRNNGTSTLSARTDPDALRVWIYLKKYQMWGNETIIPLNHSMFDLMPSANDAMISIDNVLNRTRPGSPALTANSAVALTLTSLMIPDHMCGDGMILINADPLGEIGDAQRNNNVVGVRVRVNCHDNVDQCSIYGTSQAGVSLVALHVNYSPEPSSVVEVRASTAEIRQLPPSYMHTPSQRLEMIKAVTLSHAIQAEANRLEAMGSCDDAEKMLSEGMSWNSSVLSRLAQSMVDGSNVLMDIEPDSEFESEQLRLLGTMMATIGQLVQQPGSLRTILSTVIHGDMSMFANMPGMEGYPYPGGGGYPGSHEGGDGGYSGSGYPGQDSYHSYSGGYHREDSYSGGYSGGYHSWNTDYSDYSYSGGYSSGGGGSWNSGGYSSGDGGSWNSGGYSSGDGGSWNSGGYSSGGGGSWNSGGYDYSGSGSGEYDYSGSGSGEYDYSGSGSGEYDYSGSGSYDYSGSGSYDYSGSGSYDYSGSGSYDYSGGGSYDYSGSGSGEYDYSGSGSYDYYSSGSGSYDYDYSGSFSDYSTDSAPDMEASPLTLGRKKRAADSDMYDGGEGMGGSGYSGAYEYNGTDGYKPEYNPDMGDGGYPDMGDGGYNHDGGMGGMGGGMGTSGMMGAVTRIQLFVSAIMVHVSRGDYRSLRVPGCFPEEFNDSFRRFVKALLWRTSPVQEIPGYEDVSEEFVSNVQSLIKQFMSGAQPAMFNGKMPSMFDERMGQWIESRGGFNPMMPLPSDLLEGALQQVVNISRNFTVQEWESEPEMRNMSMRLFGKMAAALLKSEGVVGNVSQAVTQIHGLLATGELDEASGTPGMKLTNNDICKRMVEMAVKKDAGGSHTAMLVMRDGDVYSVRPSPLTNDMIWKKVVACQCNHGQSWAT